MGCVSVQVQLYFQENDEKENSGSTWKTDSLIYLPVVQLRLIQIFKY